MRDVCAAHGDRAAVGIDEKIHKGVSCPVSKRGDVYKMPLMLQVILLSWTLALYRVGRESRITSLD